MSVRRANWTAIFGLAGSLGLLASRPLPAQITTGTIVGTVRDESGGVVPGVQVVIRRLETNEVFGAMTNDIFTRDPGIHQCRITPKLPGYTAKTATVHETRARGSSCRD